MTPAEEAKAFAKKHMFEIEVIGRRYSVRRGLVPVAQVGSYASALRAMKAYSAGGDAWAKWQTQAGKIVPLTPQPAHPAAHDALFDRPSHDPAHRAITKRVLGLSNGARYDGGDWRIRVKQRDGAHWHWASFPTRTRAIECVRRCYVGMRGVSVEYRA